MNKKKILQLLWGSSLALVLALIMPLCVQGAEEDPPLAHQGLDLVIIMDQSGSMGGSVEHPDKNDINGLRFAGAPLAADWLAYRVLDTDASFDIRLGVVNFGTKADALEFETTMGTQLFTHIAPKTYEDWEKHQDVVSSTLSSCPLCGEDGRIYNDNAHMGNTNFMLAMQEANRIFTEMQQDAGVATSSRAQAIILITDGQPYTGDESVEGHLERVTTYIEDKFPNHKLYVLGLNDADPYWNRVEDNWEMVSEEAKLTNNRKFNSDVQAILNKLFPDKLGADEIRVACGEAKPIPPYLDLVRFTFHKPDPEVTVDLYKPGNIQVETPDKYEAFADGAVEKLTLYNPEPGMWTFKCSERGSEEVEPDIYMQPVEVKVSFSPPNFNQYLPITLQYEIMDGREDPVWAKYAPAYPLSLTLRLAHGRQAWYPPLTKMRTGVYQTEFLPAESGITDWYFTGNSTGITESIPITVFQGHNDFIVDETQFGIAFAEPTMQLATSVFSVTFRDSHNRPIMIPQPVFEELEIKMMTTFVQGTDVFTQELIPLGYDDVVSRPLAFEGDFVAPHAGDYEAKVQCEINHDTLEEPIKIDQALVGGEVTVQKWQVAWPDDDSTERYQHEPQKLIYTLESAGGRPIHEMLAPGYTLELTTEVSGGEGAQPLTFTPVKESGQPGAFEITFTPNEAGRHIQRLSVHARGPEGERIPLIEEPGPSLQIQPAELVSYEILEPDHTRASHNQRAWWWGYKPLNVDIAFEDSQGQTLDPAQILRSAHGLPLSMTVLHTGRAVADIPLTQQRLTSPNSPAYRFTIAEFKEIGSYKLHVHLDRAALQDGYVCASPQQTIQVRVKPNNILYFQGVALGGMVLAALIFAGREYQHRRPPHLQGVLKIGSEGHREIPFDSLERNTIILTAKDRRLKGTGINRLKIQNTSEGIHFVAKLDKENVPPQYFTFDGEHKHYLVDGRLFTFDKSKPQVSKPSLRGEDL